MWRYGWPLTLLDISCTPAGSKSTFLTLLRFLLGLTLAIYICVMSGWQRKNSAGDWIEFYIKITNAISHCDISIGFYDLEVQTDIYTKTNIQIAFKSIWIFQLNRAFIGLLRSRPVIGWDKLVFILEVAKLIFIWIGSSEDFNDEFVTQRRSLWLWWLLNSDELRKNSVSTWKILESSSLIFPSQFPFQVLS